MQLHNLHTGWNQSNGHLFPPGLQNIVDCSLTVGYLNEIQQNLCLQDV